MRQRDQDAAHDRLARVPRSAGRRGGTRLSSCRSLSSIGPTGRAEPSGRRRCSTRRPPFRGSKVESGRPSCSRTSRARTANEARASSPNHKLTSRRSWVIRSAPTAGCRSTRAFPRDRTPSADQTERSQVRISSPRRKNRRSERMPGATEPGWGLACPVSAEDRSAPRSRDGWRVILVTSRPDEPASTVDLAVEGCEP